MKFQTDGKLLLSGYKDGDTGPLDFALARFNADGSPDLTFGNDGQVFTSVGAQGDYSRCVLIQSDGKIILAGIYVSDGGSNQALIRYNTNGTLDNTFDYDGIAAGSLITEKGTILSNAAIDANGRLITVGIKWGTYFDKDFYVVRYNQIEDAVTDTEECLDLLLFPNPTNGVDLVQLVHSVTDASFVITDMTGRIVVQQNGVTGVTFEIDMADQPAGTYVLKVNDAHGCQQLKFIKN